MDVDRITAIQEVSSVIQRIFVTFDPSKVTKAYML
jgi:hypothetical protein